MKNYFDITVETKIFVYCPAGVVTGGAELLHQLVDVINRNSGKAYIVYYGDRPHEIPEDYLKYQVEISKDIEDIQNNIIVIFEGYFKNLFKIKKAQVFLWWLSVDNYYYTQLPYIQVLDLFRFNARLAFVQIAKRLLKRFIQNEKNSCFSFNDLKHNVNVKCHGFQSEYAKDFLIKKGFTNIRPLKDYINEDYQYSNKLTEAKKDIVIYNPKKGYAFTKRIIKKAPDILWKPIINMSRSQVKALMQESKVYIDFGFHPGKDRIPREAAMSGCCIITGKKGSAGYYGDISIDEKKYKFNQNAKNIDKILHEIRFIFNNYNDALKDFANYREIILKEKKEFMLDALEIFTNSNTK